LLPADLLVDPEQRRIPRSVSFDRAGIDVIQQGQVFKLKAKGPDGQPLWA
jgi:hypothetical protein